METTIHLTREFIEVLNNKIFKERDREERNKMLKSRKFLISQLFEMEQNEKAAKECNQ